MHKSKNEVIVRKSWNENPFGVALTINAPLPPVPSEPIPVHDGPCPPSPFWHTRYPNLDNLSDWYPVNHRNDNGSRTWSGFMNRYAVSPLLPLSTKGSGRSGSKFDTKWRVNIPYDGYYTLKGAADDGAVVEFSQGEELEVINWMILKQINQILLRIKYLWLRVKQRFRFLSFNLRIRYKKKLKQKSSILRIGWQNQQTNHAIESL